MSDDKLADLEARLSFLEGALRHSPQVATAKANRAARLRATRHAEVIAIADPVARTAALRAMPSLDRAALLSATTAEGALAIVQGFDRPALDLVLGELRGPVADQLVGMLLPVVPYVRLRAVPGRKVMTGAKQITQAQLEALTAAALGIHEWFDRDPAGGGRYLGPTFERPTDAYVVTRALLALVLAVHDQTLQRLIESAEVTVEALSDRECRSCSAQRLGFRDRPTLPAGFTLAATVVEPAQVAAVKPPKTQGKTRRTLQSLIDEVAAETAGTPSRDET